MNKSMSTVTPTRRRICLPAILILLSVFTTCVELPEAPARDCKQLTAGDGPEDFALDTWSGPARLLVSSHERRAWADRGEIYALDLATEQARILPRVNEPAGMEFRPHGVDLVKNDSGQLLFYVITHGPKSEDDRHDVQVYRVEPNQLVYLETLTDNLLVSPNDLDALPDGQVFISNDSGTRGSFIELALGLRRANVVRYDGKGKWNIAASEIAFANGVLVRPDDSLLVSASTGDRIISFKANGDGTFTEDRTVAELTVPDNLMDYSSDEILVASHPDGLAFMAHAKDKSKPAPAVISRVNLRTGATRAIYSNDGTEISAPSTGLVYNKKLYIAQVFEPHVLRCDASDL